ncbi:hypothetical protein SAMN05414137_109201 [Streptacidiphilus jiangxiensis]|uniref:Uncharacterized protein n=3 Tax=Streptacidiphilus jiangxiensis TaxID=235985 RepID=A0A1H7QT53_STRJI|nr:hypothetical protein SAMN05414137_109201 [Streptacidiphilus jiangxiensis]
MHLLELAAAARLRRLQAPTPGVPGAVDVAVVTVGADVRTHRLALTAISATRADCARPVVRLHAAARDADGTADVVDWAELATELDHLHALGLPGDCPVQVTVECQVSDRCEGVRLLGVAEQPNPALICLRQSRNAGRDWPACRHGDRRPHRPPQPSLPHATGTGAPFAGLLEVAADPALADPALPGPGAAAAPSPDTPPNPVQADVVTRMLARLPRDWSTLEDEAGYLAALRRLNRAVAEVASLAGVEAPAALRLPGARYVDVPAVARGLARAQRVNLRAHGARDRAHWRAVRGELTLVTACFKDGPLLRLPRRRPVTT